MGALREDTPDFFLFNFRLCRERVFAKGNRATPGDEWKIAKWVCVTQISGQACNQLNKMFQDVSHAPSFQSPSSCKKPWPTQDSRAISIPNAPRARRASSQACICQTLAQRVVHGQPGASRQLMVCQKR
jgi:hypothetical protein